MQRQLEDRKDAIKASHQASSRQLSVDDIRAVHEDEWLLIKILDTTTTFGEAPAELLAHGPDRKAMIRTELKMASGDTDAALAIVHGGHHLRDGIAFRRELAHIAAEEEWVSISLW